MANLFAVMEREGLHSEHAAQCFLDARRRDNEREKEAQLEARVIATFEACGLCDGCNYFEWGPGGPDPCDCRVLRGDIGTGLDDCPGTEE